jgi:hypothetical protein
MLEVEHIGVISDEMRELGRRAMARAGAQAAAEEAAGIKRMSAFGAIADIGHCIVPMNYDAIDPKPT